MSLQARPGDLPTEDIITVSPISLSLTFLPDQPSLIPQLKTFHFMIFISNYQIKNLMKTNLTLYDDDEGVGRQ